MQQKKIHQFREILFWPLYIHPQESNSQWHDWQEDFEKFFCATGNAWRREKDLLNREGGDSINRTQYAEFVYFHPFVQRFLYGKPKSQQDTDKPAIRLFKRTDIAKVAVTLSPSKKTWVFQVDRMHLYLFETRVALLVVEVSLDVASADFKLDDLQNFLDKFRRAYPPYFAGNPGSAYAGHCPESVVWHDMNNTPVGYPSDYAEEISHRNYVQEHLTPPVAKHWQYLLQPMPPYYPQINAPFSYQQIEDERMPFMAYLAVENPAALTRGDFIRIGLADDCGNPNILPYATNFLSDFEKNHCYDRFWDPEAKSGLDNLTTRYLCCGYGFVMIGDGKNDFFYTDAESGALAHFRHIYFQMGLIAHFHKAALLAMSDRTAKAVADYRDQENSNNALETFRKEMQNILQEFLQFTHRYWFTEVSNQMQAKELFALWTGHLGSQAQFDQVKQEIQDANTFLSGLQQANLEKSAHDLAVFGIPIALVGLLGAWFALKSSELQGFDLLLFFLIPFALLGLLSRGGEKLPENWKKWVFEKHLWVWALGFACGILLWHWHMLPCFLR